MSAVIRYQYTNVLCVSNTSVTLIDTVHLRLFFSKPGKIALANMKGWTTLSNFIYLIWDKNHLKLINSTIGTIKSWTGCTNWPPKPHSKLWIRLHVTWRVLYAVYSKIHTVYRICSRNKCIRLGESLCIDCRAQTPAESRIMPLKMADFHVVVTWLWVKGTIEGTIEAELKWNARSIWQ